MGSIEIEKKADPISSPCVEIDKFLEHILLERRLSNHTLRNYRGSLIRFHTWMKKEEPKISIVQTTKQTARSYLIESQDLLARKTLANQVSALRTFFSILPNSKVDSVQSLQEPFLAET